MARNPDRTKDDRIAAAIESGMGIWQIQKALHCDWHRTKRVARERGLSIKSHRVKPVKLTIVREGTNYAAFAAHLRW